MPKLYLDGAEPQQAEHDHDEFLHVMPGHVLGPPLPAPGNDAFTPPNTGEEGIFNTGVQANTGNADIDGILSGVKWTIALTYADTDSAADYPPGPGPAFDPYFIDNNGNTISAQNEAFSQFTAAQVLALHTALNTTTLTQPAGARAFAMAAFTDLATSYGGAGNGNVTIRAANSGDAATAYAFYPASNEYGGDTFFGNAYDAFPSITLKNPVAGNYAWLTMFHELGHSVGLKHPHSAGISNATILPANVDSVEFTVMSYRAFIGAPLTGYTFEEWGGPQSYMMLDIAALQTMYGADYTSNSGDTVYTWSQTTGETYIDGQLAIDPGGNRIFATIWDGNGIDTYDLSNYTTDLRIDLRPGEHSTFDSAQLADLGYYSAFGIGAKMARANIFNALLFNSDTRSLIEHATGGTGNDDITGNQASNILLGGSGNDTLKGREGFDFLEGGPGDDTLDGGSDFDTAQYIGATAGVTVDLAIAGPQNTIGAGSDTLIDMEDLFGSGHDDTLLGSSSDNYIWGFGGNDDIDGREDNDVIEGMGGNDVLIGGDGDDLIAGGTESDALLGDFNSTSGANPGGDDDLQGGGDLDVLVGGLGEDHLDGGAGDDYLLNGVGLVNVNAANAPTSFAANLATDGDGGDIDGGSGNDVLFLVLTRPDPISFNNSNPALVNAILANGNQIGSVTNVEFVNVFTGQGDDTITGNPVATGSVTYRSVGGNDTLIGGNGTNLFEPGSGDDTVTGGTGNDTVSYAIGDFNGTVYVLTAAGVTVDLAINVAQDTVGSGFDTLTGIEHLVGTSHGDHLMGTGGANTLSGSTGDDYLEGRGGGDTLIGSTGNDVLEGGDGDDTLNGGADGDTASYQDATAGVTVDLSLAVSAGAPPLGGGAAGPGYSPDGSSLTVTLDDGGTSEIFALVTTQDTVGAGIDTLIDIEHLTGSSHNDKLTGDAQVNVLDSKDGDDVLDGRGGTDVLAGGEGSDLYMIRNAADHPAAEIQDLGGIGTDEVRYAATAAGTLTLFAGDVGIERVSIGTGTGPSANSASLTALNVNASAVVNALTMTGNAGNNTLTATAFDDTVHAGAGSDTVFGGVGNDTINGNNGADTLNGGANNDTVNGGPGSDAVNGGDNDDVLDGGTGDDSIQGGAGIDTASYLSASGPVTVSLSIFVAQATGGSGNDTLGNVENITGSNFGDTLTGNGLANVLMGGIGNDTLNGLNGADTLWGGVFDDVLNGDGGDDILNGEGGLDTLNGGANNDTLNGGGGNDTLNGGAGIDTMTGGGGGDKFKFSGPGESTTANPDSILDFDKAAGDRIDLSAIDAIAGGADDPFSFLAGGAFNGTAGKVISIALGGNNYRVEGDIDGNNVADFAILVTSPIAIDSGSFIL